MSHAHDPGAGERRLRLVPPAVDVIVDNVVAMPQSIPRRLRSQWPSLSVLALVLLSVAAIAIDFRWCAWLLAIAIAWAFGLRLLLPKRRIGWLEVRRRHTDLVCLGALLLGVVALAIATPA